jgi:hypothetical protein
VINSIYDKSDSAIWLQLQGLLEATEERLFISCKSGAIIGYEPRICFGKPANEAPENTFLKDSLNPIAIGIAQITVMFRSDPALIGERLEKLVTYPGFSMTRWTDDH